MGRAQRIARGGLVYHVLNRANGRRPIFQRVADYIAFETVMAKTCDRIPMRILAWCLMPNHWHLVLWPRRDGDLSQFMRLLTLTHTQRWHAAHETTGNGHLSQAGALQVIPDPGRCPSPRMKRFLTPFSAPLSESGLGNFDLGNKNERPGGNPKTGEEIAQRVGAGVCCVGTWRTMV